MSNNLDYYSILGVTPQAEDIVIRAAYKALAQRHHPDRNTGNTSEAQERMALINEAYSILSDPKKRKEYDLRHTTFNNASPDNTRESNKPKEVFKETEYIPDGVKGTSIAAFLLTIFWSIGNRVWIGLFSLIPVVGIIISAYLGFKGRELAWKAKSWKNLDHFKSVQRRWTIAAVILIPVSIGIHAAIALPAYLKFIEMAELEKSKLDIEQESQHYAKLSNEVDNLIPETDDTALSYKAYSDNAWIKEISRRLENTIPDKEYRNDFVGTLHSESTRAGLDPEMVLGLIEVESGFRKYAVSETTAMGYMQVMPYWTNRIGSADHNLFHLRTNLRYGTTILRHYIDSENGDLNKALERYNSDKSRTNYAESVRSAWRKHWINEPKPI